MQVEKVVFRLTGLHFTQGMLTDTSQFILFLFIIIILWLINHKMNHINRRVDNLENKLVKNLREDILKDLDEISGYDKYKNYIYDDEKEQV